MQLMIFGVLNVVVIGDKNDRYIGDLVDEGHPGFHLSGRATEFVTGRLSHFRNWVLTSCNSHWEVRLNKHRLDGLAICTIAVLLTGADQWQTVRAITNLWNALGTSGEQTSSAVVVRFSINATVVSAGPLIFSACAAISCCGDMQHFLVRDAGTDSTLISPTTTVVTTGRWPSWVVCVEFRISNCKHKTNVS